MNFQSGLKRPPRLILLTSYYDITFYQQETEWLTQSSFLSGVIMQMFQDGHDDVDDENNDQSHDDVDDGDIALLAWNRS